MKHLAPFPTPAVLSLLATALGEFDFVGIGRIICETISKFDMWATVKRIRWFWRPDTYAIALGAIIVIGSLMPPHSNDPLPEHVYQRGDLYQHVGAYALLTFFALLSWGQPLRRVGLIMTAIVCLGAVLEVMQLYVGRSFDVVDLAANGAGVIVGGVGFFGWRRRKAVAA